MTNRQRSNKISIDLVVEAYQGQQELAQIKPVEASLTFIMHAIPFGKVDDDVMSHDVTGETAWSLAGDVAFLLTGPLAAVAKGAGSVTLARAAYAAGGAFELSLAVYDGVKASQAIRAGENGQAAGYIG